MKRTLHVSLSLPLGDEERQSAAKTAALVEDQIRRFFTEPKAFVGGFHVVYDNDGSFPMVGSALPSLGETMDQMIQKLQDSGALPRREKWEGEDNGEAH